MCDIKKIFKNNINVYFYDGDHSFEAQKSAFTYFNDIFADTFIAIVDDYNREHVRQGTMAGFQELNYQVLFDVFLPASFDGDKKQWWDGLYVAVIAKKQNS